MGLFDFFKKKGNNESQEQAAPKSELFLSISRYNEYIVRFVTMQQQGNYAPIAAYEKSDGAIVGFAYIGGDDDTYTISSQEVINRMETRFEQQLMDGNIKSYTIFYHSQFDGNDNHALANTDEELKAITIAYHFANGLKGKIGLPYHFEADEVNYKGFHNFSREENNIIFTTQLKEQKDYFQDLEKIEQPSFENEVGLIIKQSNTQNLANTWCGIFGFESYRKPNGSDKLNEHFALAMQKGATLSRNNIIVTQLAYDDVILKGISFNGIPTTILPVIKTDYVIDVVNKEINEWEHVDNLEAIINGNGRSTFGLSYFATDYAENSAIYLSQKELNIKISGVVFVLDISTIHESNSEVPYDKDFTMYMPNKDLPNYACFDFVGELEDFSATSLLEDQSLKGYIMKVRLITNPDIPDFFTIDMYVTPENMRFQQLTKGMKITGMFQMQGQIADA